MKKGIIIITLLVVFLQNCKKEKDPCGVHSYGTKTISGVVIDATTGTPIGKSHVALFETVSSGFGGDISGIIQKIETGEDSRYSFVYEYEDPLFSYAVAASPIDLNRYFESEDSEELKRCDDENITIAVNPKGWLKIRITSNDTMKFFLESSV
jgi:hypothetical protein